MQGSLKKRGEVWYAIIDTKDENCKRKQKWINTKCEKKPEAEKFLRGILTDMDNNTFIAPQKIIYTDYMHDWLYDVIKNKVEYTTWESYQIAVEKHIIPYFKETYNELLLQDLQPLHFQKYYNSKYKGNNKEAKGLSANSLRKHHANIKSALDYAVKMNLITYNPSERVDLPKKEKFYASYYNVDQIDKLLIACEGTEIEAAVFITAYYGFRRGEIIGLKWKCIDFEESTITINETRVRIGKEVIVKKPKSESSLRTLPLIPDVEKYLKALLKSQKEQMKDNDNNRAPEYVCSWDDGKPLDTNYLNHKFNKILKKNDLPHIRFHDLRHSAASYLVKNGVNMKVIQLWLGHADFSTTADMYSHIDMEMKQDTAMKINDIFSKNKSI